MGAGKSYTIGHLYVDGKYICDTIEDRERGLDSGMSVDEIRSKKVWGKTAIPTGTYRVRTDIVSPKFSKRSYYKSVCGGKVPRLMDVPGYEGILIHCGSTERDSAGCIIVGKNTVVGKVTSSRTCFERLLGLLRQAKDGITIEITHKKYGKEGKS